MPIIPQKSHFQNECAHKTETLPSPAPCEPRGQAAVPKQRKQRVTGECGRGTFAEPLNPNSGTPFSKSKIKAPWPWPSSENTKPALDNILLTLQMISKFTEYSHIFWVRFEISIMSTCHSQDPFLSGTIPPGEKNNITYAKFPQIQIDKK